jgi:hypothetical protein
MLDIGTLSLIIVAIIIDCIGIAEKFLALLKSLLGLLK